MFTFCSFCNCFDRDNFIIFDTITVCLLIAQGFTIQYNLIRQYFEKYWRIKQIKEDTS